MYCEDLDAGAIYTLVVVMMMLDWLIYWLFYFCFTFSHQLGDFPNYFKEYVSNPQHRLSPSNDTKIKLQYRRIVKNTQDPFKRLVLLDSEVNSFHKIKNKNKKVLTLTKKNNL
jgi:hypothetical protein